MSTGDPGEVKTWITTGLLGYVDWALAVPIPSGATESRSKTNAALLM
jgi:hypothetical protein